MAWIVGPIDGQQRQMLVDDVDDAARARDFIITHVQKLKSNIPAHRQIYRKEIQNIQSHNGGHVAESIISH